MNTTLSIKNMVCNRCIKVVNEEISKLGFAIEEIELGRVQISGELNKNEISQIGNVLKSNGFEIIEDKNSRIINQLKTLIIELIHYKKEIPEHINISQYLASEIGYNYSYLSKLFSQVEGITLEKYIINQKIERVKELLVYDELSLNEISYRLNYSSVQHLSNQFKSVTGLTPSHYKKLGREKRIALDKV